MNAPIGDDTAINFSQSVEEIEAYFKEAFGEPFPTTNVIN